MRYLKNFFTQEKGIGYIAETPFVSMIDDNYDKVLFVPQSAGKNVEIIDDGSGFITYKKEEKEENYIIGTYTASTLLDEETLEEIYIVRLFGSGITSANCTMYIDGVETPITKNSFQPTSPSTYTVKFVFNQDITDCSSMFEGATVTSFDFSHFDTSKVINMQKMFMSSTGITSLDLSNFNTSNVTSMYRMFYMNTGLASIDLRSFNTSNVTNCTQMFIGVGVSGGECKVVYNSNIGSAIKTAASESGTVVSLTDIAS